MNLATLSIDSNEPSDESELPITEFSETVNADLLLLDRSQINKDLIENEFSKQNHSASIQEVDSALSLLDRLEEKKWHCIIIAIDQITISLSQLFKAIPNNNKNTPVIILTDEYERNLALKYIKDGAKEVITLNELEHLVYSIQKRVQETELSSTIEEQNKLISQILQNHNDLIDNLPIPYATIQEGILISSNQAFNSFFKITTAQTNDELSFLDFIAQSDLASVKKVFREFNNRAETTNISLQNITLKNLNNETSPASLHLLKTVIDEEMAFQVIIHPHSVQQKQAITTNSNLLTTDRFIRLLDEVINSKKTNAFYALSEFEINNYNDLKKQIGITRTETLLNSSSELMSNFISQDTRIAFVNSQVFLLLVISNSSEKCLERITTIQEALKSTSVYSNEQAFQINWNVGIVHITDSITDAEQALMLADSTATSSQYSKEHKIHAYNPKVDDKSLNSENLELITKIKEALDNDEFKLVYQPIVHIKDSPTPTYEVLLRMKSDEGDLILPSEFLPAAKQVSLCADIDRWVISQTMTTLRTSEQKHLKFFVNISEASIQDLSFIAWLKTNDATYLQHMVFEISEMIAMTHPAEAVHFSQECKLLGIEICIEHFGNNPDAQIELKQLNAKYCKVDGSLINHLSTNRKNQVLINNISKTTKKLGIKTIACYVQDADSLAVLWQEGIDYIQGNYLQSPKSSLNYHFNNF